MKPVVPLQIFAGYLQLICRRKPDGFKSNCYTAG